jgi:hypothetical protein
MTIIAIRGITMPPAVSFKSSEMDLYTDDTGRDQLGYMHFEVVRLDINKFTGEWKMLTDEELNKIKDAIRRPPFQVAFPTSRGPTTATMYRGDRNMELPVYDEGNLRWNLTVDFIEV